MLSLLKWCCCSRSFRMVALAGKFSKWEWLNEILQLLLIKISFFVFRLFSIFIKSTKVLLSMNSIKFLIKHSVRSSRYPPPKKTIYWYIWSERKQCPSHILHVIKIISALTTIYILPGNFLRSISNDVRHVYTMSFVSVVVKSCKQSPNSLN